MPKSEFTEAAHRQRQAWQGAIVHHPIVCTVICTIIRTIVGTIN